MSTENVDWNARREEQRETEWQLRNRVLRFMETLLDRWESDKDKFGTLEAITKQAELVSRLGRLATEQESTTPPATGVSEEFLTALLRIHEGNEGHGRAPEKEEA